MDVCISKTDTGTSLLKTKGPVAHIGYSKVHIYSSTYLRHSRQNKAISVKPALSRQTRIGVKWPLKTGGCSALVNFLIKMNIWDPYKHSAFIHRTLKTGRCLIKMTVATDLTFWLNKTTSMNYNFFAIRFFTNTEHGPMAITQFRLNRGLNNNNNTWKYNAIIHLYIFPNCEQCL